MMDLSYDLQALLPDLLMVVPELKKGYEHMLNDSQRGFAHWSAQDITDLESIARKHGLPKADYSKPRMTIVFEDLLVRFMVELALDKKQSPRLKEIMNWIEQLSNHKEFVVRNLIAGSVCEPLITTYESKVHLFVPLMGPRTRELCTMQFEIYNLREETIRLFGVG